MRLYGSTVSYEELSRVSFWRARVLRRAAAGRAACVCCGHTCAAQWSVRERVSTCTVLVPVRVIEW